MATGLLLERGSGKEEPRFSYRRHTGVDLSEGSCAGTAGLGIDLFATRDARSWVEEGGCATCPVQAECESEIEQHVLPDGTIDRENPILGLWGGRFFRYQNGRPVEVDLSAATRRGRRNWSRKVQGK